MDARREPLVAGHPAQQIDERRALRRAEGREHGVLVMAGGEPDVGQDPRTALGEVDGVKAAVGAIAAALEQTVLLEPVDEGDEPRRRRPELLGEGLLAAPGRLGDRTQQPGLRRRQPDLRAARGDRPTAPDTIS